MEGQLWPIERQTLKDLVLKNKPKVTLEIGTWKGGGSTYQIATALHELGEGHLYTCEPDTSLFTIANALYSEEQQHLPVTCLNSYSNEVISAMLQRKEIPDFVLMDGPEDPDVCLDDLIQLEPNMKTGSIVAFHDWEIGVRLDGLVSTKSHKVRPYIEQSKLWQEVLVLSQDSYRTVGFAAYKRN